MSSFLSSPDCDRYFNSRDHDDIFGPEPSSPLHNPSNLDAGDESPGLEGSFASAMSFTNDPLPSPQHVQGTPMDISSPPENLQSNANILPSDLFAPRVQSGDRNDQFIFQRNAVVSGKAPDVTKRGGVKSAESSKRNSFANMLKEIGQTDRSKQFSQKFGKKTLPLSFGPTAETENTEYPFNGSSQVMDIDGCSTEVASSGYKSISQPAGDKLRDLFEDSTSPIPVPGTSRKRALFAEEDSFNSPSSPLTQPPRSKPFEKTTTLASMSDRLSFGRRRLQLNRPSISALQPPVVLREHHRSSSQRELGIGRIPRPSSRDALGQPATKIMRRAYSICDAPCLDGADTIQIAPQQRVASADAGTWNADKGNELGGKDFCFTFESPRRSSVNPKQFSPSVGFREHEEHGKILPCFRVKDDGLMRITPETLKDLVEGKYNSKISHQHIIDCRFDYEFEGGHIKEANNLATATEVESFLLSHGGLPRPSRSGHVDDYGNDRKAIIVFHCEFSEKRAPTLAKHLRSKDRILCNAFYPKLHYPELYVLAGGYQAFYNAYPELCNPSGYVKMDDPRHLARRASELQAVRKQSKFARARSFTFGEQRLHNPIRPASTSSIILEEHEGDHSTNTNATSSPGQNSPCPPPKIGILKGRSLGRIL